MDEDTATFSTPGWTLDSLVEAAGELTAIRRTDLAPGDLVLVATRNSIYSLTACEDGSFLVDGGWFAATGTAPQRVGVTGCTAGGRALFSEIVAGPGLFLEFANRVRTTRILSARCVPARV